MDSEEDSWLESEDEEEVEISEGERNRMIKVEKLVQILGRLNDLKQ